MTTQSRLRLAEIEQGVCDVASETLAIPRDKISPSDRLIEELHCDSIEFLDLMFRLERRFQVTIPRNSPNPVFKALFTRQPFRLSDLAEAVYLHQGTGAPEEKGWRRKEVEVASTDTLPFTQLDGRWDRQTSNPPPLFERLPTDKSIFHYRRRSDGMRCILVPSAEVEIGSESPDSLADERPQHFVELDAFLIDAEPVSTTAYCRFLNSIGDVSPTVLSDWFVLDAADDRNQHMLIDCKQGAWRPLAGTEKWPMILVSWFGANAYSLWANDKDWTAYRDASADDLGSHLPSEAQWEYAARGSRFQQFPWGDAPPVQTRMRFGLHRPSETYEPQLLPMAEVNEQLGMSPFGLHHMAGNVWQWCRDWYSEGFYETPEASRRNAVNRHPTGIRSERGGSWVGPAELCRSSFRRGRAPLARGRCLGFRCVSAVEDVG